ncbi:hypothetical protein K8354_00460 [Polaribacter litorisediminis]|uniref:hypothetical protein n=1 Tax=Polaribacter litorisediminis TaxID=1908341 RepID=UPI001CBBABB5|nr:hypothetical protein [Polaribacter litorisediminis]UAM98333.1 hypothetical protein K8354_00460 [Polaribacter litorisediminis]
MFILKNISILIVLFTGVFSLSKIENTPPKSSLNLEKINVVEMLSEQEFQCRPSSKIMFYVETALVKKYRGAATIKASVYVLDRASGQSNLLVSENILVPSHKDAFLTYDTVGNGSDKKVLSNGDKIIGSNAQTSYSFSELIKYKAIYTSYLIATNKLLDIQRTI